MSNCSRHKKDIAGFSDMRELAETIGDLHYESLTTFLIQLSFKLHKDAYIDKIGGRENLSSSLQDAAFGIANAADKIHDAWQISKPFMEENPQTDNQ